MDRAIGPASWGQPGLAVDWREWVFALRHRPARAGRCPTSPEHHDSDPAAAKVRGELRADNEQAVGRAGVTATDGSGRGLSRAR